MAKAPIISVLMPVYNAEKYLSQAIESILNQSFTDFEFIIINDGSSDNSETIITSYDDSRIKYLKNEQNIRLISTLNRGLNEAKGKYLARMDADDISEPERLMKQLNYMEQNSEVGACGTWCKTIGNKTSVGRYPTDDFTITYRLLYQCSILHPSVMVRMSIIKDHNLRYDKQFLHAEDYNFWYQISKHSQLANLPEFLIQYRVHESNVSSLGRSTQIENSSRIQKAIFNDLGIDVTSDQLNLFEQFNHQANDLSNFEIQILGELLCNLLQANQRKKMLDILLLNQSIQQKWEETLNENTQAGIALLGTYKKFGMLRGHSWNISLMLKLIAKMVFKEE